jgi:hypothetical protein
MKKLFKLSIVLLVMLISTNGYSVEDSILPTEGSKNVTNLTLENVSKGSLIQIKDSDNLILYSEIVKKSGKYSKRFDFTNLPDAEYIIEIDQQKIIKTIPFSVKSSIALIAKNDERTFSKPEVVVKGNYLYVSKKMHEKQTLEIDVYFEGYDLVYNEKFKNVNTVNRVFDFSTSKKGRYVIVLKSEGKIFKNTFRI